MYTCCTLYVAQRWGREGASCFLNHCQGRFQQAGALKKPLDSGLHPPWAQYIPFYSRGSMLGNGLGDLCHSICVCIRC